MPSDKHQIDEYAVTMTNMKTGECSGPRCDETPEEKKKRYARWRAEGKASNKKYWDSKKRPTTTSIKPTTFTDNYNRLHKQLTEDLKQDVAGKQKLKEKLMAELDKFGIKYISKPEPDVPESLELNIAGVIVVVVREQTTDPEPTSPQIPKKEYM